MPANQTPPGKPFEDEILDVKKQSLYARLKRLFSTDVIVRNVGGKQLKIKDTDSIMYATDRNSLRDRFNRIRSSGYNAYTRDFALSYQAARMDLFRDYDTMDMDPIISSALDIYADECLTYNELGKMITVHSTNNNVKRILENLFDEVLNVRFNLWSWVRNMTKYGDFYLKLYVTPEYGVYMVEPISAYNVERIENSDPSNKRYVKFQLRPTDTSQAEILENYEVALFSIISDSNFLPFGKSMIEGGRRVWKQLSLMEDAMLISRIMRAPERRIFYTDIGNIPPNEVDAYMQKMMDKMKKVPYMDEQTGEYNLRFNMQNMIEDYYIPVRGGDSGTKIDTLAGMEWTGIDDLEYIKNKMMAALKIPKAFLGYEEGISGKATLASEDVRFARTIQRLQRIICSELSKIAIVHLYAQGYRDESLVDFEIELTNPSTIFEKEKIEIWQDKIGVAIDMVENKFFSYNWVYKNIFNMSEDDIREVKDEVVEDAKQKYRFTKIEEDGDDPAKPFKKMGGKGGGGDSEDDDGGLGGLGGGGGHGGGGGGGSLPDLDDLGGDEGGDEEDKGKEGEKGGDEEDKGKEGEKGGDEEDKGKEGEEVPDLKKLKEVLVDPRDRSNRDQSGRDQSDRDQTGEKKAPNTTEDPLGRLERSAVPKKKSEGKRKSALTHNFEGGSALELKERTAAFVDTGMVESLSKFIKKTQAETKQELLSENMGTGSKSMMDETQILE